MKQLIIKVSSDFIPQLSQVANECVSKGLHLSEVNPSGFIIGIAADSHLIAIQGVPGVTAVETTAIEHEQQKNDCPF